MITERTDKNEYFNTTRFFLILKRDFISNYRTILITICAVAGFVILASVVSAFNRGGEGFHMTLYFLLLYVSGFIVSSRVFKDIHDEGRSFTYITLPGSQLEKFTGRVLYTSIGYVIGTFVVYSAIAALSELINQLLFGYTHTLANPFSGVFLIGSAAFVVIQSIFLAGAVFFRKNSFIKTLLMLMVLAVAVVVITILLAIFIFPGIFHNLTPVQREFHSLQEFTAWLGVTEDRLRATGRALWLTARIFFWAVLAPLCWTVSYLKFKKVEV
jgi:hypothetical protein